MLVLSRKRGERIRIGSQITIEVRRIAGGRISLAIDAPREMRILRGEMETGPASPEAEKEKPQ